MYKRLCGTTVETEHVQRRETTFAKYATVKWILINNFNTLLWAGFSIASNPGSLSWGEREPGFEASFSKVATFVY